MRSLASNAVTALNGGRVALALLVEMQLTATLRLNTSGQTINHNGNDWIAAGSLGTIEEIADTSAEHAPLRFSLSGVPSSNLAIALSEPIRNKPCFVWLAVLDADTQVVLDTPLSWSGTLDNMTITQSGETCVISVSAEHAATGYARPKPLRYTDADQQKLYPGDTSMRFIASQAQHQDIWPAASFFRV
jgi:hypothetical protein